MNVDRNPFLLPSQCTPSKLSRSPSSFHRGYVKRCTKTLEATAEVLGYKGHQGFAYAPVSQYLELIQDFPKGVQNITL